MEGITTTMQPTKFVRLWLSDKTTAQVAKELGISDASVYTYASKLRSLGVRLPKRTTRRSTQTTINVESLNSIIDGRS